MIDNEHIQWIVQESCSDSILSCYALRVASTFFLKLAEVTVKCDIGPENELLLRLWGDRKTTLISTFLEAVMLHMDTSSDTTRYAAISAISTFASSSLESLVFVAGSSSEAVEDNTVGVFLNLKDIAVSGATGGSAVLEAWMEMLRLKMEIQAAVISSIASVMLSTQTYCHSEVDYAKHAEAMVVILRRVGDIKKMQAMNYFNNLAKQPIPVGKFAAFNLLRSFASLKKGWGLDILFGHPEFVEFLLVRFIY